MLNISLPQALIVPPLLIIFGALTLHNFKNLLLATTNYATKSTSNELIKTVKPGLVYIKNFLDIVIGKASSFSYKIEHILLVAILFALFAIANELAYGNELKEKELKLLRAQAKKDDNKKKD